MFSPRMMGRELVGPFRLPEGVKMTSAKYVEFLTYFLPWCKKKNRGCCNIIIFMYEYAPYHAEKNTSALLAAIGIKGRNSWCSPHPPLT